MSSLRLKTEKIGIDIINKSLLNTTTLYFNADEISSEIWEDMFRFYCTKSKNKVVKEVISYWSQSNLLSECSIYDQLEYDNLAKIMSSNKSQNQLKNSLKLPLWQLIFSVISLEEGVEISQVVKLCVIKEHKRLFKIFNETSNNG